ncbi:MAG: acyl-CoA dehydrogenase family protein [Nevskiales bacterium]
MKRRCFDSDMELFRDNARKFFTNEIAPNVDAWRDAGIVDREAFLKAGDMGLLCMWADEQYGGLGLKDFRWEQILIEENAAHGDPGFFMSMHSRMFGPYIGNFGNEEQKQKYLPGCISGEKILAIAMTEPDAGSDLAGMKARAEDKGDHFVLNGQKIFISNGILADVVIVAARTDPGNPHGVSLLLVERGMEGFERGRNLKKMGLKSQDTAELFFKDVKVPKENLLGQLHGGFYHLMQGLAEERLIAATGNIASARHALELTKAYVRERKLFGKPLSQFQNTRFKLAELDMQVEMATAYLDKAVAEHNEGELSATDAARLKLYSSELFGRAVDEGVQLHGGYGYMDEYPICRLYQDERIGRIAAGASEVMKEIIAREILA